MDPKNKNLGASGCDSFSCSPHIALGWVYIGTNVVTRDWEAQRRHSSFDRDNRLGRNAPTVEPHRNMRLPESTFSKLGQFGRKSSLPTGHILQRPPQSRSHVIGHAVDDNTGSVIDVNTRCVMPQRQTKRMPKKAETSEFWVRLTLARTTCKPPKSMRQEDVGKAYGASGQSAVTWWKTGRNLPKPETLAAMANDTDVSVDWLWRGVGEMRPKRKLDLITEQIVDALENLEPEEKMEVLKEIAAQPMMRRVRAAQAALAQPKRSRQAASQ